MDILKAYKDVKVAAENSVGSHLFSTQESMGLNQFRPVVENCILQQPEVFQKRLLQEFFGWGPLETLMQDADVTEILVNGPQSIWYERKGLLTQHDDRFFCDVSFENTLERLSTATGKHLSLNHPFLEGHLPESRVSIVEGSVTQNRSIISIRKHPKNPWSLEALQNTGWCSSEDRSILERIVRSEKNFLIIGETGSGKTSVANACLQIIRNNERTIIIEDSAELHVPNDVSLKLLTRDDPYQQLTPIDQQELLRRSLRLRPDRLVMGEIRNKEAKDFLMLLATGHKGCFATLHAQKAQEALIRLEMLIQLGAPQWSLPAIRRLIFLSLHYIIVTGRSHDGSRRLQGIYTLSSLEDSGLTLDSVASSALATTSSEWA